MYYASLSILSDQKMNPTAEPPVSLKALEKRKASTQEAPGNADDSPDAKKAKPSSSAQPLFHRN